MIKLSEILSEIQIRGGGKLPFHLFKQKLLNYGLNDLIAPINAEEEDREGKEQWTRAVNEAEILEDLVDELINMGYTNWEAYRILIGLVVDLPRQ